MSVFNYLTKAHREIEELFAKIINAESGDEQQTMLEEICVRLKCHMEGEEKVVYRKFGTINHALKERITEAKHDHDEVRRYLDTLIRNNVSYEKWLLTLGELKHTIMRHIRMEESLFPKAKKALKPGENKALAAKLAAVAEKALAREYYAHGMGQGRRMASS